MDCQNILALEMAHLAFLLGVDILMEALQGAVTQHETKALSSSDQQACLLGLGLAGGKLPSEGALGANI